MPISVTIIGGGNVAYHLAKAFYQHPEVQLLQLYNRSAFGTEFDVFQLPKTHSLEALIPVDVYLLAVSDQAITPLSEALPFQGKLVVHTSGNTPMEAIHPKNRRAVWYPLQSFSKNTSIDFSAVPICLEAEHPTDMTSFLLPLAQSLSAKNYLLNSYQRRILHLAAVFLNNFSNHQITISQRLCQENKIPFELLTPLLTETLTKLQTMSAYEAQTGPARRTDQQTIDAHLELLSGIEKEMYQIITKSIINTYGRKEL